MARYGMRAVPPEYSVRLILQAVPTEYSVRVDSTALTSLVGRTASVVGSRLAASRRRHGDQSLARHCTITLTMDRYTHVLQEQELDALRRLPDLSLPAKPVESNKTGTDRA